MARGRCKVCDQAEAVGYLMCRACGKAYDRWNRTAHKDHASLIEWAARRARLMERRYHRAKARGPEEA